MMLHELRQLPIALTALLATAVAGAAQDDDQAKRIALKEEKLAQPWLQKADWLLDYDDAKARAKETGKPVFAYFTRSYAP